MEELLSILREIHPDVDFETCNTLIDDQILDSIDIVTLVAEISDTFDVEVPPEALVPENFNSARSLWEMIQQLDEG